MSALVSGASRWGLRVLGLGYIAVLLLAPLVLIFYKTFEHGISPPLEAITSPDGLHALKLTLLMVAIAVPAQHGLRRSAARCCWSATHGRATA